MERKINVGLSKDLRNKYGVRSFAVAEGDIVKVRYGSRRGEGGKVVEVDHSARRISVEGLTIAKADGKQETFYLSPEKLVITKLDFSRQERYRRLQKIASIKNISIAEPEAPPSEAVSEEGKEENKEEVESSQDSVEPKEQVNESASETGNVAEEVDEDDQ
ncbi:MAG: 50S ribosomal protein L24 [Thermoplasmataceae archaeon]